MYCRAAAMPTVLIMQDKSLGIWARDVLFAKGRESQVEELTHAVATGQQALLSNGCMTDRMSMNISRYNNR